jgi:excisionase family DNA binding protein
MYYTPKQIAERYGVDEETVRRWYRNGQIGHIKLSDKSVRISSNQLEEFEKERTVDKDPQVKSLHRK